MKKAHQESIFITGSCGFVGQVLVDKLVNEGQFRLILNCRKKAGEVHSGEIEYTNMNLADTESIHTFFRHHQPDNIIHLGALARIAEGEINPDKAFITNHLGTKTLLDLAILNKVKSFVFVSSDLVRNHKSVVGITKFLSEAYIKKLNNTTTSLITIRLPNVSWTPGSVHLIFERLIREDKPITITHPDMSRRFVSREEAADIILFGLKEVPGKGILVVNKPPLKITLLASEMIASSGKDLNIEYIGIRPGEKLAEEGYAEKELLHTSKEGLSLLKEINFENSEVLRALEMLQSKPGFSLDDLKI